MSEGQHDHHSCWFGPDDSLIALLDFRQDSEVPLGLMGIIDVEQAYSVCWW